MLNSEFYDVRIVPNVLIHDRGMYKITKVPDQFIIHGFEVTYGKRSKNIDSVNIGQCHHPNAINSNSPSLPPSLPSNDTLWCVSEFLSKMTFNENTVVILTDLLACWNYDSCYWKTWNLIHYEKMTKEDKIKTKSITHSYLKKPTMFQKLTTRFKKNKGILYELTKDIKF